MDSHWTSLIASCADLCFKPWKHAVILQNVDELHEMSSEDFRDLHLIIECRSEEGDRKKERDLELEIYKSGDEVNIILMWYDQPGKPILWHGKHSIWMDSSNGLRSGCPDGGTSLEALARKLRSIFLYEDDM